MNQTQSGVYHVDGVSSYVVQDFRGDQWDAPFCFGIIWEFSVGQKKRKKGTAVMCPVSIKTRVIQCLLCNQFEHSTQLLFFKKRRAVVECKHVGALGNTEVMGLKALSIVYIWNAWSFHRVHIKHHTWPVDSLGPLTCTLPLGYKTEALLSMLFNVLNSRDREKNTQKHNINTLTCHCIRYTCSLT